MAGERRLVRVDPPIATGAWYGDRELDLHVPDDWRVAVYWPRTPEQTPDDEIAAAIQAPIRVAPLHSLAQACRRVAIVVDDLTRPTPVERILPPLSAELERAGVPNDGITIVIGTGTHGASRAGADRKVGRTAAARYSVVFHDDRQGCVRVGTTTFGSPVFLNGVVAAADLVIGIGGVYPQHTVGFGGGAKTILGALGRRSIERLHYRHTSVDGRTDVASDFRRDVAEMAALARMRFAVGGLVDARRRLVWLAAGNPEAVHAAGVAAALEAFAAPPPGDADVVIANAYPMDTSVTFAKSKGVIPLTRAAPEATRILIAAASEGVGHHGLFPLVTSRARTLVHLARVARNAPPSRLPGLGVNLVGRTVRRRPSRGTAAPNRIRAQRRILFHPTGAPTDLPADLGGMQTLSTWSAVLEQVAREQGERSGLQVVIYPCAPLQVVGG